MIIVVVGVLALTHIKVLVIIINIHMPAGTSIECANCPRIDSIWANQLAN